MTQSPYFINNGASLEDCHTNFFALADLCGIKWRPYYCEKNINDPNDDPILNSFAKCINANLLCVWRRIRNSNNNNNNTQESQHDLKRDLNLNCSKELWIFWYGDEPDLKDLVSPGLKEGDQGSWESGLSYECRTLLFKALHNLIERCLLSKGYSRLGRWFFQVKPNHENIDILKEGTQTTFKFDFFLHGDSNVCTNVDVQQHSSVRPINKEDINVAQQIPEGIRVLLSPYGLQGYLTGVVFKDNDPNIHKFLNDWNKIFPLPAGVLKNATKTTDNNNKTTNSSTSGPTTFPNSFTTNTSTTTNSSSGTDEINTGNNNINSDLSTKVVEVIIGNSWAKYPAAFVFITETDSNFAKTKLNYQNENKSISGGGAAATTPIMSMVPVKNHHQHLMDTLQQLCKQSDEHLENMKLIMTPYYIKQTQESYYLKNNFNQVINFCDQLYSEKLLLLSSSSSTSSTTDNRLKNEDNNSETLKKHCNCTICQQQLNGGINGAGANRNANCNSKRHSSSKMLNNTQKKSCNEKDNKKSGHHSSSTSSTLTTKAFHHRKPMNLYDLNQLFAKSTTTNFSNISNTSNSSSCSTLTTTTTVTNTSSIGAGHPNLLQSLESTSSPIMNPNNNNQQQQQQQQSTGPINNMLPYNKSPVSNTSSLLNNQNVVVESSPSTQNNNINNNENNEQTTNPTMVKDNDNLSRTPKNPQMEHKVESSVNNCDVRTNNNNNNGVCDQQQQSMITTTNMTTTINNNSNHNHNHHGQHLINNQQQMKLDKRHFKRFKSIYDDECSYKLRTGLLYDFSDELNCWDEHFIQPPKNRRFKSSNYNALIGGLVDDLSSNDLIIPNTSAADGKDPYEFNDLDADRDHHHQDNKSNIHNGALLDESIMMNGLSSEFTNNHHHHMHNNSTNNQQIKPENVNDINCNNGKCLTTTGNVQMNHLNGNNNHNHQKMTNGGECCDNNNPNTNNIELLCSPALTDAATDDNKNPNSMTTNLNDTESMLTTLNNNSNNNMLASSELLRMFPTPPSLEAMVASPCSTYVTDVVTATKTASQEKTTMMNGCVNESINNDLSHHHDQKNSIMFNNQNNQMKSDSESGHNSTTSSSVAVSLISTLNDSNEQIIKDCNGQIQSQQQQITPLVYMPPVLSVFITSNKYAPLENVECKNTLPPNFHYKHNSNRSSLSLSSTSRINTGNASSHAAQQQSSNMKNFHISPSHQQAFNVHVQSQLSLHLTKSKPNPHYPPPPHPSPMSVNNHHSPHGPPPHPHHKMNPQFGANSPGGSMMGGPGGGGRPPYRTPLNHHQNPMLAMNAMHGRMRPTQPPPPPPQQYGPCTPGGSSMDGCFSPSPMFNDRRSPFIFPQQPLNSPSSNTGGGLVLANQPPMNGLPPKNMPPTMMPHHNHPHSHPHHHASPHQMYGAHHHQHHQHHHQAMPGMMMDGPSYECHSLMLNLLLSDSMFNLFRDHNFESCCICVCNMNIKGNDVGIYLPDHQPSQQQQQNYDFYSPCTCGFSAITNRHLSHLSGLFYEDEVEVTGIYYDPIELSSANKENHSNNIAVNNNSNNKNNPNNQLDSIQTGPMECVLIDKIFRKTVTDIDENFLDLITNQSTTIFPSVSTLSHLMYTTGNQNSSSSSCTIQRSWKTFNLRDHRTIRKDPLKLMYDDYTSVIQMSLQIARCDPNKPNNMLMSVYGGSQPPTPTPPPMANSNRPVLHDWQFRKSNYPVNNHEAILTLKTLQPLMQESVQRKGPANEVTYNTVKGPLTWRQFHRLAGRGTECQCEPQPIPSLMVGWEKECVALAPFGLKFWEKLSLEPYAFHRDIQYIVIVPNDEEHDLPRIKYFFKELSTTYEILRLGRHTPLTKICADGIYVLGNNNNKYDQSMDDWFNQLGDSSLANKIRSYAQALYELIPGLTNTERSAFEAKLSAANNNSNQQDNNSGNASNNTANANMMNGGVSSTSNNNNSNNFGSTNNSFNNNNSNTKTSMNTNNNFNNNTNNNNNNSGGDNNNQSTLMNNNDLNDSHNNSLDSGNNSTLSSGANSSQHSSNTSGFQPFDEEEDPHKYPCIMIYVLESFSVLGSQVARFGSIGLLKTFSIMKKFFPENMKNNIHMQMLSLNSVINNDRDFRDYSRHIQLKELSFATYSQCKQQLIMQPNIKSLTGLGPAASFESFLKNKNPFHNRIQMYTSPFALAPMKDKQTELGEMFGDRREKSQILFCTYCLTEDKKWILASCTNDKGDILHCKMINIHIPNRTRRRKASSQRFGLDKLMSFIQTVMSESVIPWRLIISRLGRIGHGELKEWTFLLSKKSLMKYSRKLKDMCEQCRYLGPNEQPAIYSACLTSIEADTTLRVFPNYYTPDERFSSSCNTCSLSTPEDASCSHILVFPTSATTQSTHANFNLTEEFFSNLEDSDIPVDDEMEFLENFFNDGLLSPRNNGPAPDSPGNRQVFGANNSLKNSSLLEVDQDEPTQLLQQPLALAFYLSTAKVGHLPRWFWAHCPNLENICPVFLKSALLIHTPFVQQNTDDILQSNNRDCHPLDSNLTTDVLRYCLEGYNSLSWLVLDPLTSDRQSCLPFHIQALMQLYNLVESLVE